MKDAASDSGQGDDDTFDELREAAGAVVASLQWLLEATERVVEDPEAFATMAATGRSIVESFTSGFSTSTSTDNGGEDSQPGGADESQ